MSERYTANGITILCREVNRDTGEVAAYVCKRTVPDGDIQYCRMRSRLNPELRYFAILDSVSLDAEALEDVLGLLREPHLSRNDVTEYGGIEEL